MANDDKNSETPLQRLARMTINGMKAWERDEDGVHEGAWDAYVEAHAALGLPAPDPDGGATLPPKT